MLIWFFLKLHADGTNVKLFGKVMLLVEFFFEMVGLLYLIDGFISVEDSFLGFFYLAHVYAEG
jgi:hypothetical protein